MLKQLIILSIFIFFSVSGAFAQISKEDAIEFKKAQFWAEKGAVRSQFALGKMYSNGIGVQKNKAQAAKWYRLAAVQGYVKGQSSLGILYLTGSGVKKNEITAHAWIGVAAVNNKRYKESLKAIAAFMSPQQIAKAEKLTKQCLATNYKNCP